MRKLLPERPATAGINLLGMPQGTSSMTGKKTAPFTMLAVSKGGAAPTVYAAERTQCGDVAVDRAMTD